MTRFMDGPAAGATLFLRRAPLFLRAVREAGGEWDALDMLNDTPKPSEEIVVYELRGEPTWIHINARRGLSGVYRGGTYHVVTDPPQDDVLRDMRKWRTWALEAAAARGHKVAS